MRKLHKLIHTINIMAGSRYLIKKMRETSTNWLWVIREHSSLLIGWDYHLKGIEVYSVNHFQSRGPFWRRGYHIAKDEVVNEILEAAKTKFPHLLPEKDAA